MTRRLILLLATAAIGWAVSGCTMERGPYRVWQPGDPDPGREEFYGPWSDNRGDTVPEPDRVGRPMR